MAVRFVEFDRPSSRPTNREPGSTVTKGRVRRRETFGLALVDQLTGAAPTSQFWIGASGNAYRHAVFSLIGCPEVSQATYILANRSETGSVTPLGVGRTTEKAASLNLALIRRLGARLGANEVHIYLAATTAAQRRTIEADLKSTFVTPC